MPLAISCSECDKSMKVKDELAGKKIRCPACDAVISVPSSSPRVNAIKEKAPDRGNGAVTSGKKPPVLKANARRAEDEDDEEDSDDDLPARKRTPKKRSRKKAASNLPLILGLSGGGVAVVVLAVVLAIVFWPKGATDTSNASAANTPKANKDNNTAPPARIKVGDNGPMNVGPAVKVGLGESKPEVYHRLLKSTVWVQLSSGVLGSGALIDREEHLVVTNFHVAGNVSTVSVIFPAFKDKARREPQTDPEWYLNPKDHPSTAVSGAVVFKDSTRDLALVKLAYIPPEAAAVPLLARGVKVGEHIHSIGSSGIDAGGMWRYTWGAVRNVYKAEKQFPDHKVNCQWVETNAPTNHGDSGGPIVNDRGQLVGIVQGGVNDDPDDRERVVSYNVDVSEVHFALGEYYRSKGKTYVLPKLDDIDPSDVLAISRKMADPDPSIRIQAIRAIAELGPEAQALIPTLVKAWSDTDPSIRLAVTKALEQIGPPTAEAIPMLFDMVGSSVVEEKRYAAEILSVPNLVKKDQALAALLKLVKDNDVETRRKAVSGLGTVGTVNRNEAAASLIACLTDHDAPVRSAAAVALGQLGPAVRAEALSKLLEALADDDATVVQACSNALARMGDPVEADLPALLKTLESKKATERAVALELLARLGPKAKAALPQLPANFKDADMRVRLAAIALAGAMGSEGKDLVPQLGDLLTEAIKPEDTGESKIPAETVGDARMRELLLRSTCMIMWAQQQDATRTVVKLPESGFVVHVGQRLVLAPYSSVENHPNVTVFFPIKQRGNLVTQAQAYIGNVSAIGIPGQVVGSNPKANLAIIKLSRLPAGVEALPLAAKAPESGIKIAALTADGVDLRTLVGNLWQLHSGKVKEVKPMKKGPVEGFFVLIDGILSDYDSGYPIMDDQGMVVAMGLGGVTATLPDKTTIKVTVGVDVREFRPVLDEYFNKIGGSFKESATRSSLGNVTQNNFRMAIATALGQIGPDAAAGVKPLETALKDASGGVRAQAALALGAIGKPALEAIPELLKAATLEDNAEIIEQAIARFGKDAVPALSKALKDNDLKVKGAAIRSAGRIGPPAKDLLPSLTLIARSANSGTDLPRAATEAIESIKKMK